MRDPLVVAVQNRLEARKRAGVATADALSRTMFECIEAVSGKSGELNVEKLKKIAIRRRGAPIGNETSRCPNTAALIRLPLKRTRRPQSPPSALPLGRDAEGRYS